MSTAIVDVVVFDPSDLDRVHAAYLAGDPVWLGEHYGIIRGADCRQPDQSGVVVHLQPIEPPRVVALTSIV